MTQVILCGVDDSPEAREALRVAGRLSAQLGARVVAVHVVQTDAPDPYVEPANRLLLETALETAVASADAQLRQMLAEERVDAELRVLHGFAPDRIAELADEVGAELIVVGARRAGRFRAAALGSVSREVIAVAARPVVVVPAGASRRSAPEMG